MLNGEAIVSQSGANVIVDMAAGGDNDAIIDRVRQAGGGVVSIIPRRMRLEDLFVESVREHSQPKAVTA
jgi:hypothetical protein